MLNEIKAAIFDLDGTLVDSMWMWKDIDIEYLGRFGISLPNDLQGQIEGMSFSETANYFKTRFHLNDSIEQIKDTWNEMAYQKYQYQVPLKPGANQLLDLLKKRQIKLGIATSNSRKLVDLVTKVHRIHAKFDCIVTGCDVMAGKPSPDIYAYAAKLLSVNPEDCLVFEDVPQGILAGKRAGMKVCAVEDPYSKEMEEKKKKLADYYIESFELLL